MIISEHNRYDHGPSSMDPSMPSISLTAGRTTLMKNAAAGVSYENIAAASSVLFSLFFYRSIHLS